MKAALIRLVSSMKFWTFVLGLLTALGARYGIKVDAEIYWSIVGLTAVLIGAQGATDAGRAAAEVNARPPNAIEVEKLATFETQTPVPQ